MTAKAATSRRTLNKPLKVRKNRCGKRHVYGSCSLKLRGVPAKIKDTSLQSIQPRPAVSASDAIEFEQIIERYGALIKAVVARTYSGRLELNADDIVQEVKIKLWKELSKQEKIVNLKAFICQVAFTTTIDEIRKARTRKQEPLPEEEQEMDI